MARAGGWGHYRAVTLCAGEVYTKDSDLLEAMVAARRAAEAAAAARRRDWGTVVLLRLSLLLFKMAGFTLTTWGRNIHDYPGQVEVDLLTDISTSHYLGLSGRAMFNALFVIDDFRHVQC